jgi:hypothetical protein
MAASSEAQRNARSADGDPSTPTTTQFLPSSLSAGKIAFCLRSDDITIASTKRMNVPRVL